MLVLNLPLTSKLPHAQQRFFWIFHIQKKFSETTFTKLLAIPYTV
jgi:hypothetical protein